MVRIAPVNLPYNPKTLWFDAGELELHAGCDVVVQTARGTEFGHMPEPAFEATSDQVKKLKTPLKPVLRVADDEDRAKQAELEARAAEALPVFKELAAKVNAGEELTWDDLSKANWAVLKNSSSAGYIYPTLWLQDHYGKKITDLPNVITLAGYGDAFAQAAAEAVDIVVCYADGRNDYEAAWVLPTGEADPTGKAGMGRTDSIWNELNVIGVTPGIYNDTVSITKANADVYNPEFIAAMQQALINVINTPEGQEIFSVYSHTGYAIAKDSDYDGARAALAVVS